jgi:hypothetical protein
MTRAQKMLEISTFFGWDSVSIPLDSTRKRKKPEFSGFFFVFSR